MISGIARVKVKTALAKMDKNRALPDDKLWKFGFDGRN